MIGRRSTRDIAVATEALMGAHASQQAADIADVRQTLAAQDSDRSAYHAETVATVAAHHAENKTQLGGLRTEMNGLGETLHQRISRVSDRINAVQWWIIGGLGAVLAALAALIVELMLGKLPGGH